MGSEQSQQANAADAHGRLNNQSRLQRGHTIAVSGRRLSSPNDEFPAGQAPSGSRPVSPPISVCSDSDLPYVSYTDKLGGMCLYAQYIVFSQNHLTFYLCVILLNRFIFFLLQTRQSGKTKEIPVIIIKIFEM